MDFNRRNIFVVALSGASCSGKTTITRRLRDQFLHSNSSSSDQNIAVHIVHQDDYYKSESMIPAVTYVDNNGVSRTEQNWDCPGALDTQRMLADLQMMIKDIELQVPNNSIIIKRHVIIVEGFLVLHPSCLLLPLFDAKIHLHVPLDVMLKRRTGREYEIVNSDGQDAFWADPEGYVECVVFPEYEQYMAEISQQSQNDLTILNTEDMDLDQVYEAVVKSSPIKQYLTSVKSIDK
ncbi:hypothetical protein MIR68_006553 [Amoeboaphelidium protococcarum]|nr:hypothetical protein MIR68_006553 [Amoeboaphelidium protococcarum]